MQTGDTVTIQGVDGWDRRSTMTVRVTSVAPKSFVAAGMRFPIRGGYAQGVKSGQHQAADMIWRYRP